MRKRMNSPLFLIDIAVPRDLDPRLNDLDNVYLYDIDNLKDVVEVNKSERQKEADKAERIVEEESLKFEKWLEGMAVTPTIVEIRQKGDALRAAELEKTLSRLKGLTPKQIKSIEALAASITNKLLHNPIVYLKSTSDPAEQQDRLAAVRAMFNLDEPQK